MPKSSLLKDCSGIIQPITGRDKGVHTFRLGNSPKVNVIARLELEVAYYEVII